MNSIRAQRKQALAARRRVSPSERVHRSQRACTRVARLPVFRRARRIGIYWPMASEIDPRPLLAQLTTGQTGYLPRVTGPSLRFVALRPAVFRHNKSPLGMMEPVGGNARRVAALDLLIMPLAAFDDGARRIGMGGGYYDRTLALPHSVHGYRRPHLLGLAFEAQRVAQIETRAWDIDLDLLVTESRVRRFAPPLSPLR